MNKKRRESIKSLITKVVSNNLHYYSGSMWVDEKTKTISGYPEYKRTVTDKITNDLMDVLFFVFEKEPKNEAIS